MATIWITYAWVDNESGDVDFLAQELLAAGLQVKLDRWNVRAGLRLWDQIAKFIESPGHCDAWLLVATPASLGSEPCREEYAYALDRALKSRGREFPLLALFPSSVDDALVPAGIRTRLHVSLQDVDWKERIVAAAENRTPETRRPALLPYHTAVHRGESGWHIEVRPRAGTWAPFIAAVPLEEGDKVKLSLGYGPRGGPPWVSTMLGTTMATANIRIGGDSRSSDWVVHTALNEATPTMSYYLGCATLPSVILFGQKDGGVYRVEGLQGPTGPS